MRGPIRILLLDADGVVQGMPRFLARLEELLGGRDFLHVLFDIESAYLTGRGDFKADLERLLIDRGLPPVTEELLEAWLDIEPDPEVLALVDAVRAGGVPVYLATNQQPHRGPHLLDGLGYEKHFDGQFHSFQLGHAKPDPTYFTVVLDKLGAEASGVLFVDDLLENVEGARSVGIVAEHHDRNAGAAGVRAILQRHGLAD